MACFTRGEACYRATGERAITAEQPRVAAGTVLPSVWNPQHDGRHGREGAAEKGRGELTFWPMAAMTDSV